MTFIQCFPNTLQTLVPLIILSYISVTARCKVIKLVDTEQVLHALTIDENQL